ISRRAHRGSRPAPARGLLRLVRRAPLGTRRAVDGHLHRIGRVCALRDYGHAPHELPVRAGLEVVGGARVRGDLGFVGAARLDVQLEVAVLYARLHPRAQRALHAEAALAGQHFRGVDRTLVAHAVDHADPVVGLGELLLDDAGDDGGDLVGTVAALIRLDHAGAGAAGGEAERGYGGEPQASITKSKRPSPAVLRIARAARNSGSRALPGSPGK